MIVNESFARRYFPAQSALGRRFLRVDGGTLRLRKKSSAWSQTPRTRVFERQLRQRCTTPSTRCFGHNAGADTTGNQIWLASLLGRMPPAFRVTDVTLQSTLIDNTLVREGRSHCSPHFSRSWRSCSPESDSMASLATALSSEPVKLASVSRSAHDRYG